MRLDAHIRFDLFWAHWHMFALHVKH
uniref:Uncharacterized protein n=1 Tax=Anguilla anguilla TaxID=7936 RepID=A0A0E9P5C6_ANGAN